MKINGLSQCIQRPGEKCGPGTIACRRWLSIPLLVLVSIGSHSEAAPGRTSPAGESRESLDYFIIVTGSELLRGVYADQHTQFITRALGPLGYRCLGSMSIGDVQTDLNEALDFARGKVPLVLTTGGLGPTSQDITRKVLSDYTRITLKEHPGALTDLKRRYGGVQGILRPVLRGQALAPEKGTYLPNPNGTAVGLVFDDGQRVIAALPGPPRELRPMVRNELVPYLSDRFGLRKVGHSLTMRFAGIGQSSIDRAIRDHLKLPGDLAVWSSFNSNRVDITFSFPGNSPQELERLRTLQGDLLEHIGEYMYSDSGGFTGGSDLATAAAERGFPGARRNRQRGGGFFQSAGGAGRLYPFRRSLRGRESSGFEPPVWGRGRVGLGLVTRTGRQLVGKTSSGKGEGDLGTGRGSGGSG